MSGFEWFLVIVVVILVPLAIAIVVTLWTLEQARKRNPRNRPGGKTSGTKRRAVREDADREDGGEGASSQGSAPNPRLTDDLERESARRSG